MVYIITLLVRALDRSSFFFCHKYTDFWMYLGQWYAKNSELA